MLDQIGQAIQAKVLEKSSIQEMIARLPIGLEDMYNRVLSDNARLSQTHQDVQVLILQLVTHSARPLRLIEIAKAIEGNPHANLVKSDSKDVVRNSCRPLLVIMEDEVVQILHHLFTEFLLDQSRETRQSTGMTQFSVISKSHFSIKFH